MPSGELSLGVGFMRAQLEYLPALNAHRSLVAYRLNQPGFEFYWHYHPQYELTYIQEGSGMRLVGDSYEPFSPGDLVLLGPNLPHTWVSNKAEAGCCRALVVQFPAALIRPLQAYREWAPIDKMLQRASSGLWWAHLADGFDAEPLMQRIIDGSNMETLISLMTLLNELQQHPAVPVASAAYVLAGHGEVAASRLNEVFQYVQKNFGGAISLQQAASIAHLSTSAFCRFFKRASGKTFSDYVNEVRVASACSLLLSTDMSVGFVAQHCGFENLAYFNRVFLKKKGVSPTAFRRQRT